MTELERSTTVSRKMADVVSYLADFSHAEEWDSGTRSCTRIGEGPVEVGARWRNVSEFRGKETEIVYTLARREPQRLTFEGGNETVSTTDDMTFEPEGDKTRIHYRARFEFHGFAKLGAPFVKGSLNTLADDTMAQLTRVLDRS
jgi:carbon monoxide dehydrogenase subunit G